MIADRIPIGIGLPQLFPDGHVDTESIRRFAQRAEQLGFSDLWVQEVFFSPGAFLDAIELLTYVAPLTSRLRLGVSVMVLPRHDPVLAAKRLATLDQLSGGRLIVGVAVGPAHDAFGRIEHHRFSSAERFTETYDVIHELWGKPRARYDGRIWLVDEGAMEPKPLQRPRPSLWFGGAHPSALRRAARLGDGWMGAGSSTPQAFAEQARILREELARRRGGDEFTISKRVYIGIDEDSARAAQRFDEYRANVYGESGPPRDVAVIGPAVQCREALLGLMAAGAQHLALTPIFDDEAQMEALAQLVGLGRG